MLSFALLAMLVLHFDRSTVKHALQNTQNDCHQWLSHSFSVHQILTVPVRVRSVGDFDSACVCGASGTLTVSVRVRSVGDFDSACVCAGHRGL